MRQARGRFNSLNFFESQRTVGRNNQRALRRMRINPYSLIPFPFLPPNPMGKHFSRPNGSSSRIPCTSIVRHWESMIWNFLRRNTASSIGSLRIAPCLVSPEFPPRPVSRAARATLASRDNTPRVEWHWVFLPALCSIQFRRKPCSRIRWSPFSPED
jgi:hypothetical protein